MPVARLTEYWPAAARRRHPGEAVAGIGAGGVKDAEIVDVIGGVGDRHRIGTGRRHRRRLVLRHGQLAGRRGLAEEQIAVDRAEDAGEFGLAGDLALAARDIDRKLELAPQFLGLPVPIDLHVLQDAELVGADARAGHVRAVAPQRPGAECELHVKTLPKRLARRRFSSSLAAKAWFQAVVTWATGEPGK